VPILQLGLSSASLSEAQLNDLSLNFLRTQLITVPGAVIPYPYGGKQRQVMINLDPALLQQKGLSPGDVLAALQKQNLVLPSGTAKISDFEYDIRVNGSELLIFRRRDEIILREKKGTMLRAFELLASLPNEPTHFPKRLNNHRLQR